MNIDANNNKPLFIQIREGIETAILTGVYKEGSQLPSTTELSLAYAINPATALKGINILVDKGIIFKKRGIGMFVKEGAIKALQEERQKAFKINFIIPMVSEAKKLGISQEQIIRLIREEKSE